MHIVELEKYKVACHIDRRDLKSHGITVEDLINRTPLGHIFFKKAATLVKESTPYAWSGCGSTMSIDIYEDEVILIFSEQIEDYLYQLQQTSAALDVKQAQGITDMIALIRRQPDEESARDIIRSFESQIRNVQNI